MTNIMDYLVQRYFLKRLFQQALETQDIVRKLVLNAADEDGCYAHKISRQEHGAPDLLSDLERFIATCIGIPYSFHPDAQK